MLSKKRKAQKKPTYLKELARLVCQARQRIGRHRSLLLVLRWVGERLGIASCGAIASGRRERGDLGQQVGRGGWLYVGGAAGADRAGESARAVRHTARWLQWCQQRRVVSLQTAVACAAARAAAGGGCRSLQSAHGWLVVAGQCGVGVGELTVGAGVVRIG